jgi:hypothetical protein
MASGPVTGSPVLQLHFSPLGSAEGNVHTRTEAAQARCLRDWKVDANGTLVHVAAERRHCAMRDIYIDRMDI